MQDKLPHSTEVEEAVIGTLLTYPDSINNVIGIITPEMFYRSDLQLIYKICCELYHGYGKLDLVTVTDELMKRGVNDKVVYLTELANRIVSSAMIDNHALLIKQKYLLRKYHLTGIELANMALTKDLADVAEKAEMDLLAISGLLHSRQPQKLDRLIDGTIDVISRVVNKEIALSGVPSGFRSYDSITGGFMNGDLIIVAGRPSQGKTAFALQIAKNSSERGYPVGIFSLEMSGMQQAKRFLSGVSGYTNMELTTGKCDVEHLLKTSEPLCELGIFIDDSSSTSLLEIRAKTRKLMLKYGIKMIIVDYLQLMTGVGQNREQEVSYLSRGLKSIARDLDLPVIVLSQLNRRSEDRANNMPKMSDLRESGAIEQDADTILLIFRPSLYGISYTEIDGIEKPTKGLMLVNLAKCRNGCTGEIELYHNESVTKIYDPDQGQ